MAKVALCLSGKIGNTQNKSGYHQSDYRVLKTGYDHYKKHIIDKNDLDVFIHCWDTELESEILDLYKPKDAIIENQVVFDIPDYVTGPDQRKQNVYSRWFSNMQANNLCMKFAKNNNIKYDFIMTTRFDLAFETDIIFNSLDNNKFYVGNWTSVNYQGQDIFKGGRGPLYDMIQHYGPDILNKCKLEHKGYPKTDEGFLDFWFIANPEHSHNIHNLYNRINDYTKPNRCPTDAKGWISSHRLSHYHLENLNIIDRLDFMLELYDEFPLVRRKYYRCRK